MHAMNLEAWQRAIEEDGGSLWDVYVLDTTREDWQRLLDWLRTSGLPLSLEHGGTPEPLPQDVSDIFDGRDAEWTTYTLLIDRGGMSVNTHFFIEDEIELDIGPRDCHSEADVARLRDFLTGIAQLLGKTVLVTPENTQRYPIFEIDPDGVTQFIVM